MGKTFQIILVIMRFNFFYRNQVYVLLGGLMYTTKLNPKSNEVKWRGVLMYVCMWGAISRGFVVEREESRLEAKGGQAGAVTTSSTSLISCFGKRGALQVWRPY